MFSMLNATRILKPALAFSLALNSTQIFSIVPFACGDGCGTGEGTYDSFMRAGCRSISSRCCWGNSSGKSSLLLVQSCVVQVALSLMCSSQHLGQSCQLSTSLVP